MKTHPAKALLCSTITKLSKLTAAGICFTLAQTSFAAPPDKLPETMDDKLAKVAERVPAFGGMFYDDNGDLNIYLTNPKAKGLATAALKNVFGRSLEDSHPSKSRRFEGKPKLKVGEFKAVPAKFSIGELTKWKKSASNTFALKEAVFIDLDEASNRLTVGISTPKAKQAIEDILTSEGIPLDAVNIVEAEPVYALTHSLRSEHRPTKGGIETQFTNGSGRSTCTLGFNAYRSGVRGFVTNSHCTQTRGGTEGTLYYQASSNLAGYEYADPGYFTSIWFWECPWFKRCRYSDAAFVRYYSSDTSSLGKIARTTGWNNMSLAINSTSPELTITGEQHTNIVNSYLDKIGRTTGWTYGKVISTCGDYNVSGSDVHMKCQDKVKRAGTKMSGPGDSGSPVFVWHGSTVTLAGILWGGNRVYSDNTGDEFILSPMRYIEDELGALTTF